MNPRKSEVLITLALDEDTNTVSGAQLFPIGEWRHPAGRIKVTYEKAKSFVAGFKNRTAGQDLPVLYIHSDKTNVGNPKYGEAAGWIKDMHADPERGVTIDIEFTKEGASAVRDGAYKYLSAEYFEQVQLPHHDSPQRDVVVGAALVNRPHLKGMDPILNEETGHMFIFEDEASKPDASPGGGDPVDPILLALAQSAGLELDEDTDELTEDDRKAIQDHIDSLDKSEEVSELEAKIDLLETKLTESNDDASDKARSLAEAGFEEEARLLSEYRGERTLKALSENLSDGFKFTPAVEEAVKAYGETGDETKLMEATELLASGKGLVDLSEKGRTGANTPKGEDAGDKIIALAEDIAKEREIQFGEALEVVSHEHPELWREHQSAMGAKEVNG